MNIYLCTNIEGKNYFVTANKPGALTWLRRVTRTKETLKARDGSRVFWTATSAASANGKFITNRFRVEELKVYGLEE